MWSLGINDQQYVTNILSVWPPMLSKNFLSLIGRDFTKNMKLNKIFHKNTIKVSYSCLPNVKQAISNNKNSLLQIHSGETMASVSAGHIILTPTQPVGSGRSRRESNTGHSTQEWRALPTELPRPRLS